MPTPYRRMTPEVESSMETIAAELGVSKQRALQLEERALRECEKTINLLRYIDGVDIDNASPVELARVVRVCQLLQERLRDGAQSKRERHGKACGRKR
jgi:hypothetical protein